MKKFLVLLACCVIAATHAAAVNIDRNNVSMKAGPTDPGEKISMAWVESLVYPRRVSADRKIVLGVRTSNKIQNVAATFDFSREMLSLSSPDGMNWGGEFFVSDSVPEGVHVVRYQITGKKGTIQRTVEFFVDRSSKEIAENTRTEISSPVSTGWPLTVLGTCSALSGNSTRTLYPGQKLIGIVKMTWYKVVFEDGKEGWVPSSQIKDPSDTFFYQGYQAYLKKKYAEAARYFQESVGVNPDFARGYFWLSKSLMAQDKLDLAEKAVQQALKLDDQDIYSRVIAATIAQKYFNIAHSKMQEKKFNEAIAAYKKVVELKKNSMLSWYEMGLCFSELGMETEARNAWREALKIEPEDVQLRTLLGLETASIPASRQKVWAGKNQRKTSAVSAMVEKESLELVMKEKTGRGTQINQALKSVVALTKSLGTKVVEKGWQVSKHGDKLVVSYQCEQNGGVKESFDWLVDVDTRQVIPQNDNARLLMGRW